MDKVEQIDVLDFRRAPTRVVQALVVGVRDSMASTFVHSCMKDNEGVVMRLADLPGKIPLVAGEQGSHG